MPIRRLQLENRLAGAVIHGGVVHLAGQVADDPTREAEEQTVDILRQIDALLAEAGTDRTRLLSVQVFLADIADYAAMNAAYTTAFGDHRPARSAVAVAGLPLGGLVEIEAWALVG